MKINNIFIIFLFLLVLSSFAVAQPPFQNPQTDQTLFLQKVDQRTHLINTDYYLHTHIFDSQTGVLLDPTTLSCYYHLYSEESNWNHIDIGTLESYGPGVFSIVNKSLFQNETQYTFLVWCNNSLQGGFTQQSFYVYEQYPFQTSTYAGLIYFIIIFIFLLISLALGYFGIFLVELDNPLKYLFILVSFIFGTITSFFVYNLSKSVLYQYSNVLLTIFSVMGILTFLMFVYTLIVLTEYIMIKKNAMNPYKNNTYGKNKY